MKKNIYITAILALVLNACVNFEELNTDPTTSTVADPQSLISAVQIGYSGSREVQWRSLAAYHMPFIQMVSDGWTISRGQVYELDPSYVKYLWNFSYRTLNDLQIAINRSSEVEGMDNYQAVARILKVMIFSQLTDTYGDIPYFKAISGYNEGVMYPTYDKQEEIYSDFFKELEEANKQLSNDKLELKGDLIYNGDIDKWKKFANSMRLRLAMRLINVDKEKAQFESEAAIKADGGVFAVYSDGATVMHNNYNLSTSGAVEIRGNGFSQVQNFSEEIMTACETYVAYLRDNDDPRLTMMFGMYGTYVDNASANINFKSTSDLSIKITDEYKATYGKLIGFPPAKFLWDPTEDEGIDWAAHLVIKDGKKVQVNKYFKVLQLNKELTRIDMPTIYQSYSEVELWKAEMATYGWDNGGGDAKSHFEQAVSASLDELKYIYLAEGNANSSDIDSYISSVWGSGDAFEVINMQHYVNNFFNGIEGFANWRRSGFPKLVPANTERTDPKLNGLIPRRLPYPLSEMNYNSKNVATHLYNGVNFWGAPVWWDASDDRGVIK